MKLDEFKAWFEGFTESMDGAPSAKQWKRIKERVAEIDGVADSYPVYIDRYVHPYRAPYYPYRVGGIGIGSAVMSDAHNTVLLSNSMAGDSNMGAGAFDGVTAMFAAGKAEALSL